MPKFRGRIWRLEKQKLVLISNGGLRKNGRTFGLGSRVADAREKNGVLHIVAPPSECLLKPPKHPKR